VRVQAEVVFLLEVAEPRLREAVLRIGGIDLVVTARRRPFHNLADFARLGLDPKAAKILVVKSGYLSPELAPIANPSLMALSPGVVDQFVERLPRLRKVRPTYPFDTGFDWSPSAVPSARASRR
jgi:microcystin degradation protein MlrC